MRKINQKILISLLSFFIFFMSSAVASEQKINTTGIYIAGASESLNDAKKHALEDAMRQATEQAGVLVNSACFKNIKISFKTSLKKIC